MDQHVLQILQETLSPVEAARRHAEQQLDQLFYHPEAGLSLARILASHEVVLAQRQSAGVLLQQYITKHWSPLSHTFEEPSPSEEVKAQVRPIIFGGLSDSQRKIRLASAFALSSLARYDWPDEYPDLLSSLIHLLTTGSASAIHGAMRVITEFVKNDLSEDQLLPVVRDLLPALLAVLGDHQAHSYSTRAECVSTFRQVLRMLETVKEEHPAAVKQALDEVGPVWLGAFRQLLSVEARSEVEQSWNSIELRIEIMKTLTTVQSAFPRLLTPSLGEYISLPLQNLTSLQPVFSTFYLTSSPDAPEPPSPTSDAGFIAPKNDVDDLACAVFDFLTPVVRLPKAKDLLVSPHPGHGASAKGVNSSGSGMMEKVLEVVLVYIQVTRSNEEEWTDDPNAFVMDEDEEAEQYGARTVGIDLIGAMMDKYPREVAVLLHQHAQRIVNESSDLKRSGITERWKPLEAALTLLGGLSDDIRERLSTETKEGSARSVDLGYLFDQVIPNLLNQSDTPFLQGRAFVFSSQFASLLPETLTTQYISAAVSALESGEVSVPVKISAVKTIKNFCRFVPPSVIQPQSGRILSLLLPLLSQTTSETLYLLLETVRAVIGLDQEVLSPQTFLPVVDKVFEIWEANADDPVATAVSEEICESLVSRPSLASAIVHALAPRLASLIATPPDEDHIHVPGEAVQLANSLIRTRGGPLEEELVQSVSAAVVDVLGRTDDMDVIQHGMIHLTLLIRKDCDKLIHWTAPDGTPGLTALYRLLARFMAPTFSESGGIFVGELIMHLFRKAGGAMGDVLPELLGAVAGRLATATMPSFIQSLVLPFAYLFSTEHTAPTLELLSTCTVQTSSGEHRSALEVVLNAWCETSETVSGSWNIRVTDLGLLKLFSHPDPRIQCISVRGDLIVDESNRNTIMTRSKTKSRPHQYTQIPFPAKAFKLLLKDLQSLRAGKGAKGAAINDEIEEDDGDEEWDDDDPLGDAGGVDEFEYLSSWLDHSGPGEHDAQDDDEDLKADPIAQIDLAAHITEVLRGCYASNSNGIHEMVGGLNEVEKGIMRGLLTG